MATELIEFLNESEYAKKIIPVWGKKKVNAKFALAERLLQEIKNPRKESVLGKNKMCHNMRYIKRVDPLMGSNWIAHLR